MKLRPHTLLAVYPAILHLTPLLAEQQEVLNLATEPGAIHKASYNSPS